jgi:hypothetical protein
MVELGRLAECTEAVLGVVAGAAAAAAAVVVAVAVAAVRTWLTDNQAHWATFQRPARTAHRLHKGPEPD